MKYRDSVIPLIGGTEAGAPAPAIVSWVDSTYNPAGELGGGAFITQARLRVTAPAGSILATLKVGTDRVEWDGRQWSLEGEPRVSRLRGRPHHVTLDLVTR